MDDYKIKLITRAAYDANTDYQTHLPQGKELHDLTVAEGNLLLKKLQELTKDKRDAMRRKIIHLLCLYGMTNYSGSPDMRRIDEYVKNIGSRNPKKKSINWLNVNETREILNQVEAMVKKTIHNIKSTTNKS